MKAHKKTLSLSFRGFDCSVTEFIKLIDFPASLIGSKGELIRPGLKQTWKRNIVQYSVEITPNESWDEAIFSIINRLGGLPQLKLIVGRYEYIEVQFDFTIPVRNSDEQEGGSINIETLSALLELKAFISFGFL